MTTFARLDADGWVIGVYTQDDAEGIPTPCQQVAEPANWPARPSDSHRLRIVSGALSWEDPRPLATAKAQRLAAMRDARDAAINGGFSWSGSTFDSDQVSQTRILGLRVASTDAGFTGQPWRLADNAWRVLSAADVAGVWAALQAHVSSNFATFAAIEAAIEAATTHDQVDAVTWP